jgi:predicted amidohydrolase
VIVITQLTIALTQYGLQDIQTEQQFWDGLVLRLNEAADKGVKLIAFPEYTTAHLLSIVPNMNHVDACYFLDRYTASYIDFFRSHSKQKNMIILAGTHICIDNGVFVNKAFLFFPDGRIETQNKLHLTPEERRQWKLTPGDGINMIDTGWGKVAILTCYDIEFPEVARIAAIQGAELILCPSYTDGAAGYYRVSYTCQARAIENQLFVALSGIVGELPEGRTQIDKGFCQAGLFAPCDYPFPSNGVVAAGQLNEDMMVVTEVDFAKLRDNRKKGIVAPFYDRRPDLYEKVRIGTCN